VVAPDRAQGCTPSPTHGPTTTIGIWSAPVWLILFLIGQDWSRVCAYAVAGFGFACLAFAAISMHLMYKALGARFGFKVSWRNAPPYRYKAFGPGAGEMAWTLPPAGRWQGAAQATRLLAAMGTSRRGTPKCLSPQSGPPRSRAQCSSQVSR